MGVSRVPRLTVAEIRRAASRRRIRVRPMEGLRHPIGEARPMVAARLPIVDRLHMAEARRRIAAHRLLTVAAHLRIVELPPRMMVEAEVIAVEALLRITVAVVAGRRVVW